MIRGCVARDVIGGGAIGGGAIVGIPAARGAEAPGTAIGGMNPGRGGGAGIGDTGVGAAMVGRSDGALGTGALGTGAFGAGAAGVGTAGRTAAGAIGVGHATGIDSGVACGVTARDGVNGPGAPGRGGGGVAPAGIGDGSGGIVGRGIGITGGASGVRNGGGDAMAGTEAGVNTELTIGGGTGGIGGGTTGAALGVTTVGAASTSLSIAARDARPGMRGIVIGSGTGAIGRTGLAGIDRRAAAAGAPLDDAAAMLITPPHTEHRARTPTVGTFDGSTRKIDRHSGHVTFTSPPPRWPHRASVPVLRRPPRYRRAGQS
jgi:hypothetical protein